MKKSFFTILYLSLFILLIVGCGNSNSGSGSNSGSSSGSNSSSESNSGSESGSSSGEESPDTAVTNFFKALQQQDYASAKSYYSENLDNMAQFKNQIEDIAPGVATKFFEKLADFSYIIHDTTINPNDSSKATVKATINAYDLGKSFESTVLDYIKTDIGMTFDGAKSDDIIKQAEATLAQEIDKTEEHFSTDVSISLTKEEDKWKLDKIGENKDLLNALSGNIIDTIDKLSDQLKSAS